MKQGDYKLSKEAIEAGFKFPEQLWLSVEGEGDLEVIKTKPEQVELPLETEDEEC